MKLSLCLTTVFCFSASIAQAQETVQYELQIKNATQHTAQVIARFPASDKNNPIIQIPNWRTGRYEILPLANGMRQVTASTLDGARLAIHKTDKASWQIDLPAGKPYQISYELYANELGLRTRHIDDSHAYLNASAVFVYSPEFRANPIEVKLNVPSAWESRSGLAAGNCKHCFKAANYDVLTDSPIETGVHQFYQAQVDGKQIELAIWGEGNYNGEQMLKDYTAIVKTTNALFGSMPYNRYLFIVHATDGVGGATEHINSTVIQTDRWNFQPRSEYLKFARTSAHEFFHTWNVKAYRPKELVPYEYQIENYTNLLWISEGHTSYFENLITLRAGVQDEKEYLADVSTTIDKYFQTPGRFEQSANESSFDEWIQPSGDRHQNASVSIYPKGELIGLAMDLILRRDSAGKFGLQDVHQLLWQNHKVEQGGFSDADVLAALQKVSGHSWSDFWNRYVIGTQELPILELLNDAGLQWLAGTKPEDDKPYYWWGLTIAPGSDKEFARIASVQKDSPAWQAGLVTGDTLFALNGFRLSANNFAKRSQNFSSANLSLEYFRRDQKQMTKISPKQMQSAEMKLVTNPKASAKQLALRKAWLGK
ncbi:MAG: M61 family metallopeptidase [Arenimonas sp.]|nr:M61 family metallopeptidase [Arenimonas sp.]